VALHCLQYCDTDVGPYSEVSLAVAVKRPGERRPLTMLRALALRQFAGFVVDLPVSTEVAVAGGLDYFGFPKWLADFQHEETDNERRCRLLDRQTGELVYAFTGRKLRTRTRGLAVRSPLSRAPETIMFRSYPVLRGEQLEAGMLFLEEEKGMSFDPRAASVTPGTHERSRLLRDLSLGRLLAYGYVPRAKAVMQTPVVLGR
jgi:hypothetical protein